MALIDQDSQPRPRDNRVSMAYFDAANSLCWNSDPVSMAGDCSVEWFPDTAFSSERCHRRTIMLGPRVDECRCTGRTAAGVTTAIAYAGVDDQADELWRRQRFTAGQRSGAKLVGATSAGLVFSDLEVWSPESGETLRPALLPIGRIADSWYLPEQDGYLRFDADVTLLHAIGGLYLHRNNGRRQLLLPVENGLFGYYRVESVAPLAGTSLVLLGERYSTRGPGSARLQLFDLETRRIYFSEEYSDDHYIAEVRVITGDDGHAAFSYLDESAGEYRIRHYRIR